MLISRGQEFGARNGMQEYARSIVGIIIKHLRVDVGTRARNISPRFQLRGADQRIESAGFDPGGGAGFRRSSAWLPNRSTGEQQYERQRSEKDCARHWDCFGYSPGLQIIEWCQF